MKEILEKYWGYSNFRENQEEIIKSILDGKDVLALIKTGGGKSICFQLPALLKKGTCIVISPLISLMQDQVIYLNNKNIKSTFINSSILPNEYKKRLKSISEYKILYLSPEGIKSQKIISALKKIDISFIVFDEAHCISQWGKDFRPEYRNVINVLLKLNKKFNIIALTATANIECQKDIIKTLNLDNPHIVKSSFNRENIFIGVKKFWTNFGKYIFIKKLLKNSNKSIIYCSTRAETEYLSKKIGKDSYYYHAGMSNEEREYIQEKFRNSEYKILFATTAFGMGIDIPNIDNVIYWNFPSSIEDYYQGIGRAGRDKNIKAKSFLLYTNEDIKNQFSLIKKDFDIKNIKDILKLLKENISTNVISKKYNTILVRRIMNLLEQGKSEDDIFPIICQEHNNKILNFEKLKKFVKTKNCYRKELLKFFDEDFKINCNNCSNCYK
ncbi:MAG: hypothetical protein KatS3mg068_2031 [Candidatus Sericytochromatia bacterium]|nr:MAG: hypothetical protein KatS3mg068_2031 [Candidatus Sericytochromatia bacterium]